MPFDSIPLRSYPPLFGLQMVRLHRRFCQKRISLSDQDLVTDDVNFGLAQFASLSWDFSDWWQDANMTSVFIYLRGSKDLDLGNLRPMFPQEI